MFSGNTSQVSADQLYVEDVFSTWLYTGNGSTNTITNGIDLSGKGGLVWLKERTSTGNNPDHWLFDTARGGTKSLTTNSTGGNFTWGPGATFSSTGFSVGNIQFNTNGSSYASWTFREAPKFFDVVTYTGTGANRTIAHNLGVAPGCILVKRTDAAADWQVYHRSNANTQYMVLNTTAAKATGTTRWNSTTPTATEFTVGTDATVNASGGTYVAYLYAHDATSDGVIQCGSFTTDGTGAVTVNLGWEPQWLLYKRTDATQDWVMIDNMRGFSQTNIGLLNPNTSVAETQVSGNYIFPTATGFQTTAGAISSSAPYIYIAIRRGPMKTPTLGTSVFAPVTVASSVPADTIITTNVNTDAQIFFIRNISNGAVWVDRLRGVSSNDTASGQRLFSYDASAESSGSVTKYWQNTGFKLPGVFAGVDLIYYNFRRAPGFFDEVCYTGTGVARTVNHNLGVPPELVIVKSRSISASDWRVNLYNTLGSTTGAILNSSGAAFNDTTAWNSFYPTSTQFGVGSIQDLNSSGATYVAYLFASCPGVSKVGSYTGNGSSQTINCGFAAGARFVMIKRTNATGDWYVWDTARGIVAGNDPHLSLNTTAAEVTTDDTIDTDSSGFVVNQVAATNVNVSSATYLYLAIA